MLSGSLLVFEESRSVSADSLTTNQTSDLGKGTVSTTLTQRKMWSPKDTTDPF